MEAVDNIRQESPATTTQKPKRKRRITKAANGKLNAAERQELENQREIEYNATLRKLESIEPDMERGDEAATLEWLDLASTLIDGFRETKALFPSDGVSPIQTTAEAI